MIAALVAGLIALQSPFALPLGEAGNWVVVAVSRVIAPDQHRGQCYVQARVERVIRGAAFKAGDTVGLTVSCTPEGPTLTAFDPNPEPPTIRALRAQKRALVHVDEGGRVLRNGYYGLDAETL